MKKFIFIIVGIFIAIGLLFGAKYILSLRTVMFDFADNVESVTVYSGGGDKVKQVTSDRTIQLTEGEYYVIPAGSAISKNRIDFLVKSEDSTIVINPNYNREYLDSLLKAELPKIEVALSAKYPDLIGRYALKSGSLYGHGEWYGGILAPKVAHIRDQRDPYKIILHKEGGAWHVVRRPEYVLTASRYKEVPIEVLKAVNAKVE